MAEAVSAQSGAIAQAFESSGKKAALMPYMMGGFPDLATSLRVGETYVDSGGDLIELGVPFSDPLADGPAIQAAGEAALANGATLERILGEVAEPLAQRLPIVLMCYSNPIISCGFDQVASMLAGKGVAGLIVPDMPAREAGELRDACDKAGIDLVPLVAPTTRPEEVEWIASQARGFVYVVAVTGVTGERDALPAELGEVVPRAKAASSVPVAVGFGVGTPEQAAQVGEIADGVIVGSRLVRAMSGAADPQAGLAEVAEIARAMAAALK
jgi:tryptophan synthase alpha chain